MASGTYNSCYKHMFNGEIDFEDDDIYLALVTSDYTPDFDAHEYFDDLTNEVVGTGYTAGGKQLTDQTVTQDNDGNQAIFDATIVVWTNSEITARAAILYKSTGNAATSPLIRYYDFAADYTTDGGSYTITWPAVGIAVMWT